MPAILARRASADVRRTPQHGGTPVGSAHVRDQPPLPAARAPHRAHRRRRPSSSTEEAVPEIGDGEALVRTLYISLDPTNRTWIDDTPTYLPPVGDRRGHARRRARPVVASKHPAYPEGAVRPGTARLAGLRRAVRRRRRPSSMPDVPGVPLSAHPRRARHDGADGVRRHDRHRHARSRARRSSCPRPRAPSARSPAQIAKIEGARVVGIAGGPEKCAMLTDELGFDAAVDYKAPDWRDAAARPRRPDGIDVDFENVGGEIMDAVFARLNLRARVALCGLISGYNDADPPPGPRASARILDAARARPGLHRARPLRPGPGGRADRDRRVDGRGRAQGAGDGRRGLRAAARSRSTCCSTASNIGKLVVKVADPA